MPPRQQGRWSFVLTALLGVALLLLLFGLLQNHFDGPLPEGLGSRLAIHKGMNQRQVSQPDRPNVELQLPPGVAEEKTISAGMHIENIYALSLKDRVFMAEGWYWLKWSETINELLNKYQISQERIAGFINLVEANAMVIQADQPSPTRLDNGNYWQLFHFSGKFYVEDLELRGFPFDVLTLPFVLELQPEVLTCYQGNQYGCVTLQLDQDAKGDPLGEYISLNGYKMIGTRSQEFMHKYLTNFGIGDFTSFGAIRQKVIYRTEFRPAFLYYIFPLLVLVTVVIIAPSLPGALGDVRLAIPTTILLTLIFLQIGYKADLPALAYVSYLDWLYIYAYVVSASLFILFCWGTNAHSIACAQGKEESVLRRINRVDFIVQVIAVVGLVLMLASGLLFKT